LNLVLAVGAAVLFAATSASASPILYIGSDPGADTLATAASSVAARASFDAAAGAIGTITFETAPLGNVSNTSLGGGVTVDDFGTGWLISNSSGGSGSLYGLNTTPAGQYFLTSYPNFSGGSVVFTFATPINAFGAYMGGLQGNSIGQQTVVFGGNTANIPLMSGGISFVGFIDPAATYTSVTLNFNADYVTVDDVRFGQTNASAGPVPEPATLVLLGSGLGAAALRRRRQRQP
jgi:hypothetical protein